MAPGYMEAERRFRKIQGHRDIRISALAKPRA
jgi:hypothetical protein